MGQRSKYLPLGSRVIVKATLHHRVERNEEGTPWKSNWEPRPDPCHGMIIGVTRVRGCEYDEDGQRTESTETVYLVARNLHRRAKVRLCDVAPVGEEGRG